jgi:predicted MFS family arabinose efflux permease
MAAGLKYVKSNQLLWATLLLILIVESSGWTFHTTVVPIFARNELGTDSTGLGVLLFAFGLGAVVASLFWAMFSELRNVGKSMIASVNRVARQHLGVCHISVVLTFDGNLGSDRSGICFDAGLLVVFLVG